MAYRDEDLEAVDYDRAMTINGFVMMDVEKNVKRDRSKFRSDAEYRIYLESWKDEKESLDRLAKLRTNNG